jgi:hypothetical protein
VKLKNNKISPLDADFRNDKKPIKKKWIIYIIISGIIIGYGLSEAVAQETVKFKIYNQNMKEVKEINMWIGVNQTIIKAYYLKNFSPVPAKVKVVVNFDDIEVDVMSDKEETSKGELSYIEIRLHNPDSKGKRIIVKIEGEYER